MRTAGTTDVQDARVLIVTTFALAREFTAWRRLRPFRRDTATPVPVYEAMIGAARVRVVITGIGRRAAAAAAAEIFADCPDVCIAAGLAGGLGEPLRICDVVAPNDVLGADGVTIETDPGLLALAVGCGAVRIGTLHSAPDIVVTAAHKRRLSVFAEAVDMESSTILAESRHRGVAAVALRVICDPASMDLPLDLNHVLSADGRVSAARTMLAVAARPRAIPGLVRLMADSRRAAGALATFLDTYVERTAMSSTLATAREACCAS
jgi:adenosylhomocysteine nucleosidase